jgi:hypothetical protein
MELRKTDNCYGACLAAEPPLPLGLLGGMQITNTHFRQQPANQRSDSDCLQYLKSDVVISKKLLVYHRYNVVYDRFIERVFANYNFGN